MNLPLLDKPPKADRHWTAGEVCAAIRQQYGGGESHAVLFEVRNATGFSADRSIDAVVMSLWPSLGLELWGMEIKVSRQDWRRELEKPEKASRTFEYFDRWFLVAPPHVALRHELPAPWGWMQPTDKGLKTAVQAPVNPSPKPVDRKFLGALMRRTARTDDAYVNARIQQALLTQKEEFDRDVDRRVLSKIEGGREDAKAMKELREALGVDAKYLDRAEVIAAARAVIKSGAATTWQGLFSVRNNMRQFAERIDAAIKEMNLPDDSEIQKKKRRSV